MNVTVDGVIFENQSRGGISRVFCEILPRMCELDESLQITLLTAGKPRQRLPTHSQIRHRCLPPVHKLIRPSRWFRWAVHQPLRAAVQQVCAGVSTDGIWHSSYYTLPRHWSGPIVVTVPDLIREKLGHHFNRRAVSQFRRQTERCLSAADVVICISNTTRQDLLEVYPVDPSKVEVIPLAASEIFTRLEHVTGMRKEAVARPFILYVGGRYRYKNFDLLLKAYSQWNNRSDFDLVVVGRSWSKHEQAELQALQIHENVHLVSQVSDERLCFLYNQGSAFVYPSLYEGFGIPLLEAMSSGCPVVASRIPSTIEVAGECAIYFEPHNVDSLLSALDIAMLYGREPDRINSALTRARLYSWRNTAQDTLAVYRTVFNGQGRA